MTGTSATLPTGWVISEIGPGANSTYSASDGSGTAVDTYSFGPTGSSDRALGSITSQDSYSYFGVCIQNNTGGTLRSFSLGYTGEHWRGGSAPLPSPGLVFQYSTTATSITGSGFQDFNQLSFAAFDGSGTGPVDGNAEANRQVFPMFRISPPVGLAPGGKLFLRWILLTSAGTVSDGLAIDDVNFDSDLCVLDADGNGTVDALTDGLILIRAMLGQTGTSVIAGAIGAGNPQRTTWAQIRTYLNEKCGTTFGP